MMRIAYQKRVGGRSVSVTDATGGVFVPDQARGVVRPIYSFGPPGAKALDPVFSCPVGVLKPEIWRLLELWFTARMMGALPVAGGVVDQPVAVLRAFPVFETEHRQAEQQNNRASVAAALGAAVTRGWGAR